MNLEILSMLQSLMGFVAGGLIGTGFGILQDAARRQNERRQLSGELKSGWRVMPGAGARVALLVILFVLIQIICPLLFRDGTQWWVSGGVAAGYGLMLFLQLRQRLAQNK